MPNFKPKNIKQIKIHKKNVITIDGKHKEFLNEFEKDEKEELPKLQERKEWLKKNIEKPNFTLEEKLDMVDQMKHISKKMKEIKNKKKEYLLDNSKYIFDYFENKKDISTGKDSINISTPKTKALEKLFKIKKEISEENFENQDIQMNSFLYNHPSNNNINHCVQKYFNNVDENFIDINSFVYPTDICQICYKG